ncbi:tRNA pseudouridine(38-40) synthase TruA [Alphaproteobacteria bacterium]|nr:tRNA pseudouridine(38-40) synthase TruA [Alphaproteobacteria bacterium]
MEINNTIKYALLIEYNGNDLVGWQKQNEGISVQSSLEDAAKNIFNEEFEIQGSGRTDAGVHALGQIAHINLPKGHRLTSRHPFYIISAFNSLLRDSNIRVISTKPVKAEFNARFSAIKRFYKYRILCRAAPPGLDKGKVWHFRKKLDISLMQEGVKYLIGKHDFTSFRTIKCQAKSPVRTIDEVSFSCEGEEVIMRVSAKSFLHSQVRIIAGTIVKIGDGTWDPEKILTILKGKNRNLAGPTAPADGLYLERVKYPENLLNDTWPIIYDSQLYN